MAEDAWIGDTHTKVGRLGSAHNLYTALPRTVAAYLTLCNGRLTASECLQHSIVNKVVPLAELDAAVKAWTDILAERSPTALALAKRSFNADSENIRGISLAMLSAVKLFYETEESKEGVRAFKEKRKPDFHKYVK